MAKLITFIFIALCVIASALARKKGVYYSSYDSGYGSYAPAPSYDSYSPAPAYNSYTPSYDSYAPAPAYDSYSPAPAYSSYTPYDSYAPAPTYNSYTPSYDYVPAYRVRVKKLKKMVAIPSYSSSSYY